LLAESRDRIVTAAQLKPRHAQLIALVGQGKKNAAIAALAGMTENSVKVTLSRIYRLMGYSKKGAPGGEPPPCAGGTGFGAAAQRPREFQAGSLSDPSRLPPDSLSTRRTN